MPKGWLYDWEGIVTKGRQNPETRLVESLLVVYLCVSSLSLIDAQSTVPVPIRLVTNWPHHSRSKSNLSPCPAAAAQPCQ
jgi:hypothetical protein